MLTIGEFAQVVGVSARMLRHYDKIGILAPASVDPWTGYRYYAVGQIPRLHRIVALRDLGFTLDQIGRMLDTVSVEELRGMLLLRRSEIEQEMAAQQDRLAGVEARLRLIERSPTLPSHEIILKSLPAVRVAAIATPQAEPTGLRGIGDILDAAWPQLETAMRASHTRPAGHPLTFATGSVDSGDRIVYAAIEVASDTAEVGTPGVLLDLPAVAHAATVVRAGPLDASYPSIYQALAEWIEAHGYQRCGPARDVFVDPRPADGNVVLEIQWPVHVDDSPPPDLAPQPVKVPSGT